MRHTIENEFLTVTVETKGAELVSVVDKATGAEMMWDGQTWEGGQHGFGRDFEHEFVGAENGAMRVEYLAGAFE